MTLFQANPLSKAKAKTLSELLQKKRREEHQKFLVEGVRLCMELLDSDCIVDSIVVTDRFSIHPQKNRLVEKAQARNILFFKTTEETLKKLTDTCNPQPIVACGCMRSHKLTMDFFRGDRFLVLIDVSEPGNVGTLLRSAEAFGWDGVVCVGETVEIYNPKILRASMGSAFRLNIACTTLDTLMSFFEYTRVAYFISMPHQGAIPPFSSLPPKLALFLGNEAHGLPGFLEKKAHGVLRIPMSPNVESLNVSVAGGILLYMLSQRA